MKIAFLFIAFLPGGIFFATHCTAQVKTDNPLQTGIDSSVDRAALAYMKDSSRQGLSVGIVYQGHSYTYNYGQTGPSTGQLPTSRTLYEIGSVTKTFTALLLVHTMAGKKISLNDDIRKYLKGAYPNLQYANGEPVKVVYLLAHISRFPRVLPGLAADHFTSDDVDRELEKIRLDTLRPYKYQYSNAGYQVLGKMLENIYGKTYDELLHQEITGPLHMGSTKVRVDDSFPGAGAIRSSMADMNLYMDYQLKEADPVVKMTHHPLFGDLSNGENANALPWTVGRTRDWDYFIREDGGTKGYRCFMVLYPDYQLGIMLMTNQTDENAGRKLYEMTAAIFKDLKAAAGPVIQ
jgi:CubicO group peptidase (beta-lactamase class C family)